MEAIEFYEKAFNCKTKMRQTYGDYVPEGIHNKPHNLNEWILHAEMEVSGSILWFADEIQELPIRGNSIKLTISLPTKKQASDVFLKLSEDANVFLPPTDTFYSTFHAGLVDRFGNHWTIVAEEAPVHE